MKLDELKTPFDDDSHTFRDGALGRFFRTRKWMIATGLLLALTQENWLDIDVLQSLLAISKLPTSVLVAALTSIGIYLLAQAVLVIYQIRLTYMAELDARVSLVQHGAHVRLRAVQDESLALLIDGQRASSHAAVAN